MTLTPRSALLCFAPRPQHRLYNATDALFYASFAIVANWPQLQLALQREVAAYTPPCPPPVRS